MKLNISLSLSKEIVAKVDVKRGLATRSAFIEHLISKSLEKDDATI
jgi:metal-responsive CopG/Arc/MetJ family transcriptional regulator